VPHARPTRNPQNRGWRALLLAVALVLTAIGAMSVGASPASASAPPDSGPPNSAFMSGTVDVGSCVSALPRPECDTEHKGDWHFYVVVGVLTAGLTFIGWRIVRGIKARDRAVAADHRSP
jgi:hypothetical protein